jgi:dimethylargininase
MTLAITRDVSPRFHECEITHIERTPIDYEVAREQHQGYVRALRDLGCIALELPAEADLPDSVFVEDTAVILPEAALLTRPGADSRKPETLSIARALAPYREIVRIEAPATLDGGDVLVVGKKIFVGMSTRSKPEAVRQMNQILGIFGYESIAIELGEVLHLKSAVTRVDDETLLINPKWVDKARFMNFRLIEVDANEPQAANCLPVNGAIIYPVAYPKTMSRLEAHGFTVKPVVMDEFTKAEGAVTCCSLIVE